MNKRAVRKVCGQPIIALDTSIGVRNPFNLGERKDHAFFLEVLG